MKTCHSKTDDPRFWRGLKKFNEMGRPNKVGLSYFALDTDFLDDFRIRKIIRRQGSEAVLVYIAILGAIYKASGYYLEVDEDTTFILAEQTGLDEECIMKSIQSCVAVGLFDEAVFFKSNALTSRSIQLRYVEMYPRCRVVPDNFMAKYRLIGREKFPCKKNAGNPDKNEGNPLKMQETPVETDETPEKTEESPHKVKKSKVNKNKEKETDKEKEKKLSAADAPLSGADAPDPVEPETKTKTDFKSLVEFVNAEFAKGRSTIPRLRAIDGMRRAHTLARIREYGEDALREVVRKAAASDFLNGDNNRGWTATFDWLVLPNNFIKVLEGNYDNNKQNGKFNAGLDPRFNFSVGSQGSDPDQYPDVL